MSIVDDSSAKVVFEANAIKKVLVRLGQKRFGTRPEEPIEMALRKIWDVERLERMSERLLDASSWEELLSTP